MIPSPPDLSGARASYADLPNAEWCPEVGHWYVDIHDMDVVLDVRCDDLAMEHLLQSLTSSAGGTWENQVMARTIIWTPPAPAVRTAQKFHDANPRFVWNIGAIKEEYPEMPEQGTTTDLIDRMTGKPVVSIAAEWGQLFCLEHQQHGTPLTALEDWLNDLSAADLASEGLPKPEPITLPIQLPAIPEWQN